ncbi:MAG: hypothetical protein HUK02_05315, partial [Bacteroidaceae bacterium]|nr:hypothetical protein [Bacteroidaceae bacterium]
HFGVAVSTKSNTNPDDFETIAEWTTPPREEQWREYKVDLSKYAGKNIWVALRHFDCYKQRWLLVDNIMIANIMSDEEMKCKWVNDSPSMGLAAAGEGNIHFNAINIYAEDLVAYITVNAYKDVDGGKAYGRPMTFKVIVAAKETAIEQITTDDSNTEYYNVNGVRVPAARLVPGIYIRRCGDKFDKVLVK